MLEAFGFDHRQQGSHHIFTKVGIIERINLQSDGPKAKKYQVRQVRNVLTKIVLKKVNESKYEVIIYWDKDDEVFVAEVPELPGCMAHGSTKNKAVQAAEDAISLWLQTANEDGISIPQPRGKLMYA